MEDSLQRSQSQRNSLIQFVSQKKTEHVKEETINSDQQKTAEESPVPLSSISEKKPELAQEETINPERQKTAEESPVPLSSMSEKRPDQVQEEAITPDQQQTTEETSVPLISDTEHAPNTKVPGDERKSKPLEFQNLRSRNLIHVTKDDKIRVKGIETNFEGL